MVVGGMTQYLAKVQTMPKQIESTLTKIIRDFMWNGKKPSVNIDTLYLPVEQGGVKLLDLKVRNQAIDIMWLKSYLDLTSKRPMWAYVADILINNSTSKATNNVSSSAQLNTYLQSWNTSLHATSKLPEDIIQMMKTGQKFGVSFEALKLSDLVKEQLPAWYHLCTGQHMVSLNNQSASKCLRDNHLVKTVGQLIQHTKRERDPSAPRHSNRANYACNYCKHDRQYFNCATPNKCSLMARRLLDQLQPKWHPFNVPPIDGLTHTLNRILANITAHASKGTFIFNPSVTSNDGLSHNFRVFTELDAKCVDPGYRKHPLVEEHVEETTVHIAGACLDGGFDNAQAGGGVWFGLGDPRNAALKIPGLSQSK